MTTIADRRGGADTTGRLPHTGEVQIAMSFRARAASGVIEIAATAYRFVSQRVTNTP